MNIFDKVPAVILLTATLSAPAIASDSWFESDEFECASGPKSEWMSKDDIRQSLTVKGYDVRKIELEDGCYEAYSLKDGKKYEIYVNPTTGAIEKTKKPR